LLLRTSNKEQRIVFVSNPPFFGIAMWAVCAMKRWKYTYIVYDFWPEKGIKFGFYDERGVVDRVWTALHARVFEAAERVVTLGEKMKHEIVSYSPSRLSEKTTIIHNWADAEFITPVDKTENWFSEKHGLVERFTLLYSGNIGLFHDLETPIRGVAASGSDTKFLVIGEGDNKESMMDVADSLNCRPETVEFLPYQPHEDLPYSLTCADVAVVTVQEGFEGTCVSSKLYTALASGQALLVVAQPNADEAQIVQKYDAGQQVEQGDVSGVVNAIRRWQSDPELLNRQGRNARAAFEEHFTKERSIDRYYEILSEDTTE